MIKKGERGKVKLGLNELTDETRIMLDRLDDVVASYGNMMSIKDLLEIINAVKAECGEEAEVSVNIDDYFGNSVNIKWWRPETDEEWDKRLERNKNIAAGQRKKRAIDKKNKEAKERAEFARLKKKYSAKKS